MRIINTKKTILLIAMQLIIVSTVLGNTYTVTNTNDSGTGSLREAITNANANSGADNIKFNISGSEPYYIFINSALPALTDAGTFIDGTTQPNYVTGTPNVYLWSTSTNYDGITIDAADCKIDGMVITGFKNGIYISDNGYRFTIGSKQDGNVISANSENGIIFINNSFNWESGNIIGNKIGTDEEGLNPNGNNYNGIYLYFYNREYNNVSFNIQHNIISANGQNGLYIDHGSITSNYYPSNNHFSIQYNKIGSDINGSSSLGNGQNGIKIYGYFIELKIDSNLISGNIDNGIYLTPVNSDLEWIVSNNNIGTNITGLKQLGNSNGIYITGYSNCIKIGGFDYNKGNLISGNYDNGIYIENSGQIEIEGNKIGVDSTGINPLPNKNGIIVNSSGNNIGSTLPNTGNIIAYNEEYGVKIIGGSGSGIRRNKIYCNQLGGVKIENGANGDITTPVITQILSNQITGTAQIGSEIEIYYIDTTCQDYACDQGKEYIATVMSNALGEWVYNGNLQSDKISVIARDMPYNNSSEFSFCGTLSSEKEILSYYLIEQTGPAVIDTESKTIDIEVASGTDITNLIPNFTLSDYAEIYIGTDCQESGVSVVDFTLPVTYSIMAQDGSLSDWIVTVVVETINPPQAYCFVSVSPTLPIGPSTFFIDQPSEITNLGQSTAQNTIISGTWVNDKWIVSEYYDNVALTGGNIYTVDINSGKMTSLCSFGLSFNGLSYDENSATLYGITNNELYKIDLTNADTTSIGLANISGCVFINLACDKVGNLYSVNLTNNSLYSISPVNGAANLIGDLGIDVSYAQDMEFDKNSGILYMAAYGSNFSEMRIVDKTTGNTSLIGSFPSQSQITGFAIPYVISSEAEILDFHFQEQVGNTVIDSDNNTVTLQVGSSTNITNLIAIFTLSSGASAKVNDISQTSGITSNDFTNPVIYEVTANDNTIKNWTITVNKTNSIEDYINNRFKIYPNPTSNKLYIESAIDTRIEIYNSWGEKIFESTSDSELFEIETDSYKAGVYFIKIIDGTNQSYIHKTIIL